MATRGQPITITPTRCRQTTGLTHAELECVVAILACQRAEGGLPTSKAIREVTGRKGNATCSNLVEQGVLVRVDTTSEGCAVYGVAEEVVRRLGFGADEVAA